VKKVIIIAGPTASGKSALAIKLAHMYSGSIINSDSRQVIKEFPLLTDNPRDLQEIPHLLYGYKSFQTKLGSFSWCMEAAAALEQVLSAGRIPILVGGTGFYLRNLLEGHCPIPEIKMSEHMPSSEEMLQILTKVDPDYQLNPRDKYRIGRAYHIYKTTKHPMSWWAAQPKLPFISDDLKFYKILLIPSKDLANSRIIARTDRIFPEVLEEVGQVLVKSAQIGSEVPELLAYNKIIGLQQIAQYLQSQISLAECKEQIVIRTRQYAKAQRTWFRYQMNFDLVLDGPEAKFDCRNFISA